MRRQRWLWLVVVVAIAAAGCGLFGAKNVKSFSDMTYAERATYFQDIYNKQYDDAMAMGKLTNLSDAQRKVYNVKRAVLQKAWPLIKAYRAIVVGGGLPEPGQEQEINNLINQLLAAGL